MAIIKELMDLTYPYRRQAILQLLTNYDSLIQEYPALDLVFEVSIPTQKAYFFVNVLMHLNRPPQLCTQIAHFKSCDPF